MMNLDRPKAEAIAGLVHALRPDWDVRGVMAALAQVKHRDPFLVALAAVKAARAPGNRTPAVIALSGTHWSEGRGVTETPADEPLVGYFSCARCRWIHRPEDECRIVRPERAAHGAAACRAEMVKARREQTDRDAEIAALRAAYEAPEETA